MPVFDNVPWEDKNMDAQKDRKKLFFIVAIVGFLAAFVLGYLMTPAKTQPPASSTTAPLGK
jgi:hypothetical protein